MEPYGESTVQAGQDKRIPAGEYSIKWYTSVHYPQDKYSKHSRGEYLDNGFPNLYNGSVSAGRGILIHAGNTGKDSTGCLLPGCSISTKIIDGKKYVTAVQQSTVMFYKLIDYIEKQKIENVKIIITESYEDYKQVLPDFVFGDGICGMSGR